MKEIAGIYVIISPTNKFYVGQSWNINKRWNFYRNLNCKKQHALYNSFIKHGVNNHVFNVLEVYIGNEQKILNKLENNHWNDLKLKELISLNIRQPNGSTGKLSEETKMKMSLSHKGKECSDITKKKLSESLKGKNLGKLHTNETKEIISKKKKGALSLNHKNNIRNSVSKLSINDVVNIWRMLKDGHKQKSIATQFKVDPTRISDIKRGKYWNDITKVKYK